jgi:hypothetical protein
MRSSAQFDGTAKTDHPDLFAVFFAKQSHGTHVAGFLYGRVTMLVQHHIGADLAVDQMLYLADFVLAEFLKMRKVETQDFVRNIGTFFAPRPWYPTLHAGLRAKDE